MFGSPPDSSTIKQWEEAGASLATALGHYLHLSLNLGVTALKYGTPPNYLATRIDSALQTLHVSLDQQVTQARSTLAHTRNRIVCSINRLPNEILPEIFLHVIFPDSDLDSPPMKKRITTMYRSLYDLISVCSEWKKIILARGYFWSIIPITDLTLSTDRSSCTTRRILESSSGTDLHLAAVLDYMPHGQNDLNYLSEHASRVQSINIMTKSRFVIIPILDQFRQLDSSGKLSEISINYREPFHPTGLPGEFDYIFLPRSTEQELFKELLARLSIVRLSGSPLSWDGVTFSHRLVELELRDFSWGYDIALSGFLAALPPATQLQNLKIISVETCPYLRTSQSTMTRTKISLPSLQNLVLRDLYYNTFHYLLMSLTSHSHRLTLHLTNKAFQIRRLGASEPEDVFAQTVVDLFRGVTAGALWLSGDRHDPWMSPEDLWELLNAMPGLDTLVMDDCDYDLDYSEMLERPSNSDKFTFPWLKTMQFTRARIRSEDAFKSMVETYSNSLERMELGACIGNGSEFSNSHGPVEEDEDIAIWLQERVPEFELINPLYTPPEFRTLEWEL
ncbi:unnamed protein product [Rhizoctonia solani]|uniref:F-box domain-containing protein n=1 Tax=Rhizoctonia solani TaxID=456999 RepID=A0A8H2ZX58_9AGAM|nr:unnamed protein product [Rhizoctonia solani]